MNDMIVKSFQTPIEIALGVDESGMTTARRLYDFLELRPDNFSRWCKTNITQNEFAEEAIDYMRLVIDDETPTGGKIQREDFKLTAHFAKKLSMKGAGAKAEQAREYFTQLEERVKQKVIDRSQLSPQMQMFYAIADHQAEMELEQKRLSEEQKQIKEMVEIQGKAIQTVKETFTQTETEEDLIRWVTKSINKIAESPNFKCEYGNRYAAARVESYQRLIAKTGCRLDQKLRNAIERAKEKGYTKAQIDSISKLTVIMADKKLKAIYVGVIKEMMIAYCVEV